MVYQKGQSSIFKLKVLSGHKANKKYVDAITTKNGKVITTYMF